MSSDFDHIGSVVLNPFMTKVVVTETLQVNVSDPPSHGTLKTSSSRRDSAGCWVQWLLRERLETGDGSLEGLHLSNTALINH